MNRLLIEKVGTDAWHVQREIEDSISWEMGMAFLDCLVTELRAAMDAMNKAGGPEE